MPISISVGKRTYQSTDRNHAEECLFLSRKHDTGDLSAEMDGWPCTGERGHDCHQLFIKQSLGRTITLSITADHGGYARNHDKDFGATGTIIYHDGTVQYR